MRWSGFWLLAMSAVGPVSAQAEAVPDAAPTPGLEPAGPGMRWRIPPVVWGGSIGYDLRLDRTGNDPHATQHLLTTTLNGVSYIYQPWLAMVGGSVSVTQGRNSGGVEDVVSNDRFVTGALRLGLFPRSRFPLEMRYEVSDSRTDTSLGGGVDYRSRTFAVTQRYVPPAGEFNLTATYERRAQEGPTFGEDTQESLLADFSTRWKRHALNATLSRSANRRGLTGEEIDFRSVVARHTYSPGSELNVETNANWAATDEALLIGPNASQVTQWSSIALWRPDGQGLSVSASARGFTFSSDQLGDTETLGASVGANYDVTRNLRVGGFVNATHTTAGAMTWVGSLTGTYQGDTVRLGEANYNWYTSAAASQSRSRGLADNALSTQLGHTVSHAHPLDSSTTVTANLSQALSASYSYGDSQVLGKVEDGLSRALTHTAGLSWYSIAVDRNAFVRVSLSDARQLDGDRAHFSMINLQINGTFDVDRFRSWSADMTMQRVFQSSLLFDRLRPQNEPDSPRQITHSASGEITWRQQRLFGVPRLRFQSRLRLSYDTRSDFNELLPVSDREDASWENRIDYQIGRLDTRGLVRVSRTDGVWRGLLHVGLVRNF